MALIVQKFGGTSLADADKIHRAARRAIRAKLEGHQVVVVVSAMSEIDAIREPYVKAEIIVPSRFIGNVMQLSEERRGTYKRTDYLSTERVVLVYEFPMAEVIYDYFDRLKSATSGYATMDYEIIGFREDDLVKLNILVNNEPVDALSVIVHRTRAEIRGRKLIGRLRKQIERHLFDVPIQAAIGGRIIARETIKALRKDVTAKCYGGDISRKRKLLEKQKEGKKRMHSTALVMLNYSTVLTR